MEPVIQRCSVNERFEGSHHPSTNTFPDSVEGRMSDIVGAMQGGILLPGEASLAVLRVLDGSKSIRLSWH